MSLAAFQDRFAAALADPANDTLPPAFAVYRNTTLKGAIDALAANYPAVQRLVGEEWFRAGAAVFARAAPPRTPMLVEYGAGFAEFLATFPPAAELGYLADVARVDRFWTEAHIAADAVPLEASALAALDPQRLATVRLRLHPSARWRWFETQPVHSIWSRNRREGGDEDESTEIDWRGEGALVVRPQLAVEHYAIDRASVAFLDACAAMRTLGEAAQAALDVDPDTDLSRCLAQLIACGVFICFSERSS